MPSQISSYHPLYSSNWSTWRKSQEPKVSKYGITYIFIAILPLNKAFTTELQTCRTQPVSSVPAPFNTTVKKCIHSSPNLKHSKATLERKNSKESSEISSAGSYQWVHCWPQQIDSLSVTDYMLEFSVREGRKTCFSKILSEQPPWPSGPALVNTTNFQADQ